MANTTQLTDKIELIFWPYLRLTLLFLAGYGLLDSALLHWLPGFDPPNDFWKLLGPGVVAAALVLLLLWRRLRLLADTKGRGNLAVAMSIMATAPMAFGANYLHGYLHASLGRMVVLDSPATPDANRLLGTYYRFQHKYQTSRWAGIESQSTTSDKGRNLNFHLYVVAPLFASPADTGRPATFWQGLHYSAQISAHASGAEKKAAYQAFLRRTETQFEQEKFAIPTGYYERIPNTNERAAYIRAARSTSLRSSKATAPLLILQPGQASLATLKRSSIYHLASWLSGGIMLFLLVLLFPYLSATSAQAFRTKHYY